MRSTLRQSGIILSCSLLAMICACGGGGSSSPSSSLTVDNPPVATAPTVSPAATSLNEYQTYTFSTTATDPDLGDSVASCTWDFGDGSAPVVVTTGPNFTVQHAFLATSAGFTVKVTPKDTHGLAGNAASTVYPVVQAANPFTTAIISPSAATTEPVYQGSTTTVTFSFTVTYTGSGTVPASGVVFNPGNAAATAAPVVTAGSLDGTTPWTITQTYPSSASIGATYTASPTVVLADSLGVQSLSLAFPTLTFQTVVANPTPPSVVITTPQAVSTQIYALEQATVAFNVTDIGTFPTTVTVDWGDGTTPWTQTFTGTTLATGVAVTPPTHPYQQASAGTGYTVTVSAVDTQASGNTATPQTRTFVVLANALPTATITTPQASGTLPASVDQFTPSNQSGQLTLPPTAGYPEAVVIPLNGMLNFNGTTTNPTSGEAVSVQWTFPGGNPGTSSQLNAGSVSFAGVPGKVVAYLVELQAIDTFGRSSSQVGQGVESPITYASAPAQNTTPFRKWVIVDGTQTQDFYLNFYYRQKFDNLQSPIPLAPVVTSANGLGAQVQVFQDGVSNLFTVQSGSSASVIIPVRSNLPFWISIPSFGTDNLGYVMKIPNAPTGPYADPSLVTAATMPAAPTEGFFFANAQAPYNPTLNLVTGQGYAPEGSTPAAVEFQGWVSIPPMGGSGTGDPNTNRWFNFLSVPITDKTATQFVTGSTLLYTFSGISAYQSFPEWVVFTKVLEPDKLSGQTYTDTNSTVGGQPSDLGFTLNRPTYISDNVTSKTFSTVSLEAFRVPAGTTDPYNLSTGPANWNQASCSALTLPMEIPTYTLQTMTVNGVSVQVPVANAYGAFIDTMLYGNPGSTPLSGGLQGLNIPYDPNNPDRPVLTPTSTPPSTTRNFGLTRKVFSMSEYLWSSVWVRPLNLNTANLAYTEDPGLFSFYRYSSQTTWPKYTTQPGITPDGSTFDLTVNNGGAFDAGSPVTTSTTAAPDSKAVGRFWWAAFTPDLNAAPGGCIARTWLADPATSLIPTTYTAAATDANNILGFIPPVDPVVDKRLRDANGNVVNNNTLGGYRIMWFNPTKQADGVTCVPPDFWAVELTANGNTTHFLLPASFPAAPASGTDNTQSTTSQLLTDARYYLPSGHAPSAGPAAGDTVAPGYCWFDVPPELRPTSGTATIIVFALKSIQANNPTPGANPRPLNRTDWIDAIKTATANMLVQSGTGKDLSYVYKVPFNYGWDIVVTNCEVTTVAP